MQQLCELRDVEPERHVATAKQFLCRFVSVTHSHHCSHLLSQPQYHHLTAIAEKNLSCRRIGTRLIR